MKKAKYILIPLLFLSFFAFTFFTVQAQPALQDAITGLDNTAGPGGAGLTKARTPIEIVASVIKFILGFLGILFIILLMYGGFLRMTAQGESGKVETSTKIITSAIVGVIIILSAYVITIFVINNAGEVIG